jgi:pantetheine-phosphate adenylyltransferase
MKSKIAVFPGSFDPITIGHVSIVNRALPLFDKIIVAIGHNSSKNYFFSIEKRKQWIDEVFKNLPQVSTEIYSGLTVDFCKKINANYILRGLRNSADFEFEKTIAQMNNAMETEIETIFMMSNPEFSAINSTIVRDIIRNGGNAVQFLPQQVKLG